MDMHFIKDHLNFLSQLAHHYTKIHGLLFVVYFVCTISHFQIVNLLCDVYRPFLINMIDSLQKFVKMRRRKHDT